MKPPEEHIEIMKKRFAIIINDVRYQLQEIESSLHKYHCGKHKKLLKKITNLRSLLKIPE